MIGVAALLFLLAVTLDIVGRVFSIRGASITAGFCAACSTIIYLVALLQGGSIRGL